MPLYTEVYAAAKTSCVCFRVSCSLCTKYHEVLRFAASVVLGFFVVVVAVVVVVAAVVVTDFYRLLTSSPRAKAVIQFGVSFADFTPQCPL